MCAWVVWLIPYLLAGTSLTTSTSPGLPNTMSTVAYEINRTTLGLLDYLGFYVGKHLETPPALPGQHAAAAPDGARGAGHLPHGVVPDGPVPHPVP